MVNIVVSQSTEFTQTLPEWYTTSSILKANYITHDCAQSLRRIITLRHKLAGEHGSMRSQAAPFPSWERAGRYSITNLALLQPISDAHCLSKDLVTGLYEYNTF
jgi:hypothetical protein